jgi:hypothetical protein
MLLPSIVKKVSLRVERKGVEVGRSNLELML